MGSRRYEIVTGPGFDGDMRDAAAYYHRSAGMRSVERFLAKYGSACDLLASLPGHGTRIEGTTLRWRALGVFALVYQVDEGSGTATLLRLSYLSSSWLARLSEDAG